MKGQVSILEMIIASIALFTAFSMMISSEEFHSDWKKPVSLLQARDILVTSDRIGKLYDHSFSPTFNTEFLNRLDAIKDSIVKYETSGAIKNAVYVACDCTAEQVTYIQNILNDIKFNTRTVAVTVCSTTLPAINNCGSGNQYPNSLVIWGYKDLAPYISVLTDFINNSNSLIEIADIPNSKVDGQGADDDEGHKRILGLKAIDEGNFPNNDDTFIKPQNTSLLPYQSYKWFYHLPYALRGTISEAVPTEGGIPPCGTGMRGEFKFQDANHRFWICGTASVYWDTNGNNIADKVVTPRNKFSIGSSNFLLNYIDTADKMRISFKPDYTFFDFIARDNAHNKIAIPVPNNKTRVLLSMGYWDLTQEKPISGITFNGTEDGKTIWIADFARSGLTNTGDDHKQLLASLILSTVSRETKQTFQQVGQTTSYININSTDVLEIYKLYLTIGKPF